MAGLNDFERNTLWCRGNKETPCSAGKTKQPLAVQGKREKQTSRWHPRPEAWAKYNGVKRKRRKGDINPPDKPVGFRIVPP
jgi:hypothetical protein